MLPAATGPGSVSLLSGDGAAIRRATQLVPDAANPALAVRVLSVRGTGQTAAHRIMKMRLFPINMLPVIIYILLWLLYSHLTFVEIMGKGTIFQS